MFVKIIRTPGIVYDVFSVRIRHGWVGLTVRVASPEELARNPLPVGLLQEANRYHAIPTEEALQALDSSGKADAVRAYLRTNIGPYMLFEKNACQEV